MGKKCVADILNDLTNKKLSLCKEYRNYSTQHKKALSDIDTLDVDLGRATSAEEKQAILALREITIQKSGDMKRKINETKDILEELQDQTIFLIRHYVDPSAAMAAGWFATKLVFDD